MTSTVRQFLMREWGCVKHARLQCYYSLGAWKCMLPQALHGLVHFDPHLSAHAHAFDFPHHPYLHLVGSSRAGGRGPPLTDSYFMQHAWAGGCACSPVVAAEQAVPLTHHPHSGFKLEIGSCQPCQSLQFLTRCCRGFRACCSFSLRGRFTEPARTRSFLSSWSLKTTAARTHADPMVGTGLL